jgi:hypothetical protein
MQMAREGGVASTERLGVESQVGISSASLIATRGPPAAWHLGALLLCAAHRHILQ